MQTSIEWLWEQIPFEFTSKRSAFEVFEQAKEMHKQEIMVARQDGFNRCFRKGDRKEVSNEQYYQEKFKKD
jgi:hypothetical protein